MDNLSLISRLRETVNCKITTEREYLELYGTDWTRNFTPDPLAIAFPQTVEDIKKIVIFANKNKLPLTPSGGRTGLSAGASAFNKELVVSLERMNKILSFNEIDQTIEVEAGVTTQEVQKFAVKKELYYPIDLASKGSSQIGGNIATNAGGIHVIRYGSTKNWVKGLKIVTGAGKVLNLNKGLTKNATGYNLKDLIVGSEGTLGFVVEATLQLTQRPLRSSVMLIGINDISNSVSILSLFRQKVKINAFEFFSTSSVQYITRKNKKGFPINNKYPYYLIIDIEASTDRDLEKIHKIYQDAIENDLIGQAIISQTDSQSISLWNLRENITEAISEFVTYKNDVSVKTSHIPKFINDIEEILQREYTDFCTVLFGHIGDGNIHINILKPKDYNEREFLDICKKASTKLFKVVAKYRGSISAEHGVGLVKKPYLNYTRTAEEINIMKKIKRIFDPNNILNPGKVFPD